MSNNQENGRQNDSLQSSETDPALGQDESAFGAGGQMSQQELENSQASDRETGRDPTVPRENDATTSRH